MITVMNVRAYHIRKKYIGEKEGVKMPIDLGEGAGKVKQGIDWGRGI